MGFAFFDFYGKFECFDGNQECVIILFNDFIGENMLKIKLSLNKKCLNYFEKCVLQLKQ